MHSRFIRATLEELQAIVEVEPRKVNEKKVIHSYYSYIVLQILLIVYSSLYTHCQEGSTSLMIQCEKGYSDNALFLMDHPIILLDLQDLVCIFVIMILF